MYFLLKKVKIIFFIYFFNTIIKYNLRVILYFIIIMQVLFQALNYQNDNLKLEFCLFFIKYSK
ncbi:hypothetical protein BAX94_09635 [Elizabethkingia meningoseptica]|uniref:Uncharacterized protein n=1 Tax=Elizabethkingia meningoseptica TaxID=238 RepID=A0A1V3U4M4_ELIME|nr:hypothetical protein BBD35_02540 [Elizabethkingia meningoseptica]ODM52632.1 hypothetical protein BES09_13435 [Elizabethkingia meningoseptica]OHT27543.1 hypothetical protein BFF93_13440 [Elizabethkingia meningoseptica]OHT31245.1 hypothetical protein BGC12_08375 [Elizabethkingia meningoseptica]OOH97985.1 hypothetical protein BMF97_01570 [Elizabethkingia meningoseptica]